MNIHPHKGLQNGRCNVTRCQQPGATWFNHSTRAWYCPRCARDINDANRADAMKLYGHDLCQYLPESPDEAHLSVLRGLNHR